MELMEFLGKLGIKEADAREILTSNEKIGNAIQKLAREYMAYAPKVFLKPYEVGQRAVTEQRRNEFLNRVKEAAGEEPLYKAWLLFWLHCIPYAREQYLQMGIPEEIFWDTMKDITYKMDECRQVYEECGVFSGWFFLHFDWQVVAFGRLQYQIRDFIKEHYAWGDFELNRGDPVYALHIPSSGKLTVELCMDSLQRAYEFLKKDLKNNILPVVCNSWLLFPPYVEQVFGEGSNLKAFAQMFDVMEEIPRETFEDGWRLFGAAHTEPVSRLPRDTTLQRNMVRYIENGGGLGFGYGVLLYDGEKRKIINR